MYQIDLEELTTFYNNSLDSIIEIFDEFLIGYDQIKTDLIHGYESNQPLELKGHLHHHSPMFSYIGLANITYYFQQLEKKCLEIKNVQELEPEFKELLRLLEIAKTEVEQKKQIIVISENS